LEKQCFFYSKISAKILFFLNSTKVSLKGIINFYLDKHPHLGGGMAELVAHPPADTKVRGLNHRGPKYS
jgi:hypothetical protein